MKNEESDGLRYRAPLVKAALQAEAAIVALEGQRIEFALGLALSDALKALRAALAEYNPAKRPLFDVLAINYASEIRVIAEGLNEKSAECLKQVAITQDRKSSARARHLEAIAGIPRRQQEEAALLFVIEASGKYHTGDIWADDAAALEEAT